MRKYRIFIIFLLVVLFLTPLQFVSAHSGRTDKYGGHNSSTGYHYHNGGSSSSGSSSSTYTAPKKVYPSSVKVTRPSSKIYAGRSIKFSGTVSPSNSDDKSIKWFSSNESVATISSDGTLTPIKSGTTTITATTSNGMTDKFEITIFPIEAESISFANPPDEIEIGKNAKLSYTITPSDTKDKTVFWESSNPEIIVVDYFGNIEALSLGEATITVMTENKLKAECTIKVYETEVSEIQLKLSATECNVGDIIDFEVTILPENATYKNYIISYSNPNTVEIIDNNSIKLLNQGELIITATSKNGKTTSATLNVVLPVSEIIIEQDNVIMYERENLTLVYEVLPIDSTIKEITWVCLDDGLLSVDSLGNIMAIKSGGTTIKAVAHNGIEKSVSVNIKPAYEKWFRDYGWYALGGGVIIVILGMDVFIGVKKVKK